jgi:predicted acetyltransferase
MAVEIRTITDDEVDRYSYAFTRAFGDEVVEGEQDRLRSLIGVDNTHAAFDDNNRIVATMAAYPNMRLAVPGAVDVSAAGLSRVSVATSHRRQGILRRMMEVHLNEAVGRREAVSILWASDPGIYGRFGFGQASELLSAQWNAAEAGITRPERPDTVDQLSPDEAAGVMPDIRERCRTTRPGMFRRTPLFWEKRNLPDYEWMREGNSSRRYVMVSRSGEPVGYASYRQKEHWTDYDLAKGKVMVQDVVGVDDVALHTLWWFLSSIDLFPEISVWLQPTDSMIPWLATNARAVRRSVSDGLHLRVLDVTEALSSRRYQMPGHLTFSVIDPQLEANVGTYALTVDDSSGAESVRDGTAGPLGFAGRCQRTDAEPMATISAHALGALYLGSGHPRPLTYVGHIQAEPSVVALIESLFGWPVAAFCDDGF